AGSWFSSAFAQERVPTMAEAVAEALARDMVPLMERKDGSAAAFHEAWSDLQLAADSFRVISFDWTFLTALDAYDPNYRLGALGSGGVTPVTVAAAQAAGADFLDWEHTGVSQATVDLVHAAGMELHVWTVDDSSRMDQLVAWGVDGITTNRPDILQQRLFDTPEWADLNGDGQLDASDWAQYHAGRGIDLSGLSLDDAHKLGDLDGDLDNDLQDFLRFKRHFVAARGAAAFAQLEQVPEPLSLLLAVGAMVPAARRRHGTLVSSSPTSRRRFSQYNAISL
ncbi:MAG: glycerophosphodiester phosphodiesterase, partial [Planctomycetales bacterium]|nr:glycerophosphodiester phosphodiesterase [Planctomycetales bacterium]